MRDSRRTLCLTLLLGGCAATQHGGTTPVAQPQVIQMEPMKISVSDGPNGHAVEAYDAGTLFEQAGADLEAKRFAEAAAKYDRIVKEFADSRYVVASLYNAGLALEGQNDFVGATQRYRQLVDQHGQTKDALDAWFRMGACYAEVNNWAASADAFAQVLEHKDLSLGDRVEAAARRGLAQFQMKDYHGAERTLRDSAVYYHQNETVERLDNDFFLAMTEFYLGEIAHEEFRALPLRLPQKQLEKDLEAKAQLLLVTQGRYLDAARVRNPAWATAAGYQIGMLYRELYDALMGAPIPPELNTEARQIYVEELRKQIEPLLRKALHAHELTQGVAERNGVDNDWVRKSNAQMAELRALLTPSGTPPEPTESEPPPPVPTPPHPSTTPASDKMQQPPHPPAHPDEYHPRVVL